MGHQRADVDLDAGHAGAGEAFNTPCAIRATANILPPEDRALGNGLFNCGAATGALVAPFLIAPIAEAWGWRRAFLLVGVVGAGRVALWWTFTRSRLVESRPAVGAVPGWKLGEELAATLGHPAFWLLAVFSVTINPCWYFCADWIPKYMHDQRGFAVYKRSIKRPRLRLLNRVFWALLFPLPLDEFLGKDRRLTSHISPVKITVLGLPLRGYDRHDRAKKPVNDRRLAIASSM